MLVPGKIPPHLLRRLLATIQRPRDRRVVVGPGIGLDAAAIDIGSRYLVVKSDPITMVGDEIGAYALTINANDVATMGAVPRWFLATILLPPGTRAAQARRIFGQLRKACRSLRVTLCGGHTEVTEAVTRPVVVGSLLGECVKSRLVTAAGARVGDAVLLTKGIPIEAVSILARERRSVLRRRYPPAFVARCRKYLTRPGISVVRDAHLALRAGGVHAMHDPTEGGLSTALYELAEAARVGLVVEEAAIPVLPEAARLCADLGINPLGAIASGALLICAAPAREPAIRGALARAGIAVTRIGRVVPRAQGLRLVDGRGRRVSLPRFATDELARVLTPDSRPGGIRRGSSR